jgi:hypothetical protein
LTIMFYKKSFRIKWMELTISCWRYSKGEIERSFADQEKECRGELSERHFETDLEEWDIRWVRGSGNEKEGAAEPKKWKEEEISREDSNLRSLDRDPIS